MAPSTTLRVLPHWLAAAWWGSLTTIGFLVVPLLFVYLPTPAMAGGMAAHLFAAQTAVSTVCGMGLLLIFRANVPIDRVDTAQAATLFVVTGVLLALLAEFAVAPRIVAREDLALWHRVGSGMYLLQWLCTTAVLHKLLRSGCASSR